MLVNYQDVYRGGNGWGSHTVEFDEKKNKLFFLYLLTNLLLTTKKERTYVDFKNLTDPYNQFESDFDFKERFNLK